MPNERGFTLLEILVSLAIFAMIVVGALGVLGAADSGGFLEGFPSAFATARVARDYTAASVYLQAFNEFVASKGSAVATAGAYCVDPSGTTFCTPDAPLPGGLAGYPEPPAQGYQLSWQRLNVLIQTWYWDDVNKRFSTTVQPTETLTRVESTLTWSLKGATRSVTVERFIP